MEVEIHPKDREVGEAGEGCEEIVGLCTDISMQMGKKATDTYYVINYNI